jgi:hypothetical protein
VEIQARQDESQPAALLRQSVASGNLTISARVVGALVLHGIRETRDAARPGVRVGANSPLVLQGAGAITK